MGFLSTRGLVHPWKQIIYYDFDKDMTKGLLSKIIRKCEKSMCKVRGIVCDMGNKILLRQLGVNQRKMSYWFPNPSDSTRYVYIFPDMPHCLKLLRNHTLDEGIVVRYGNKTIELSKEHFEKLLAFDGTDFKLAYKVTPAHLEVRGIERQRVRPAMQLFSNSVSQAFIQVFGTEYQDQAKVIQIVDDWVDVMNSGSAYNVKELRCGLGKMSAFIYYQDLLDKLL